MIFVTIGTSEPFDRLMRAVDSLELDEQLVVQLGRSNARPRGAECVDFLDFDSTVELMRRARVVLMHAGVGSVLTALRIGKRPVVVPRLYRNGEAVDDHQVPFAERVEELGLASYVRDIGQLESALREHDIAARRPTIDGALVADIRDYLAAELGENEPRRDG